MSDHPDFGNPFSKKERRAAFDENVKALRKLFPNAKPSFIRKEAQSRARAIAVPPKTKLAKLDRKACVAVTYRKPTRAERQPDHAAKMADKRRFR